MQVQEQHNCTVLCTNETSNIMEKDASHERLHPVQERPLKGGIAILMGNLNTKVGFDNTWLGHVERGFDSTASSLVAS